MTALVRDLTTRYPVEVIELETLNFQGYAQHHYHGKFGLEMGPVESMLFSLCFCPHCHARGHARGLDVDRLRLAVQQTLDRFCEEAVPSSPPLPEYVAGQPELDAFLSVRADTVSGFTRTITEAVAAPVYYYFMGDYHIAGMRYSELAGIADRVVILAYTPSPDQVGRQITDLRKGGVSPDRLIVGFQAYPSGSPDAGTLERTVRAAREHNVAGYCFYNYGIMPRKNLGWVKAAVNAIRGE
jgi:hypothetical protein